MRESRPARRIFQKLFELMHLACLERGSGAIQGSHMPANDTASSRALSDVQIQDFIRDGFVRIDHAFPRELADEGRTIMWRDLPCDPANPATWTKPDSKRHQWRFQRPDQR